MQNVLINFFLMEVCGKKTESSGCANRRCSGNGVISLGPLWRTFRCRADCWCRQHGLISQTGDISRLIMLLWFTIRILGCVKLWNVMFFHSFFFIHIDSFVVRGVCASFIRLAGCLRRTGRFCALNFALCCRGRRGRSGSTNALFGRWSAVLSQIYDHVLIWRFRRPSAQKAIKGTTTINQGWSVLYGVRRWLVFHVCRFRNCMCTAAFRWLVLVFKFWV